MRVIMVKKKKTHYTETRAKTDLHCMIKELEHHVKTTGLLIEHPCHAVGSDVAYTLWHILFQALFGLSSTV